MSSQKKVLEKSANMKKLILPRQDEDGRYYVSYSQHNKWRMDKKDYFRQYFFGEKFDGNAYTDFGSKVGEALEKNDFSAFTKAEANTLKKVTRLKEFERRLELDFGPFFVLCFVDTNDKKLTELIDYKTGTLDKKSYYKDDFYDQLAIYAAAMQQETGIYPINAHVELIERTGNPWKDEKLKVGKEVIKIKKNISPKRVEKACSDILKTAKEINIYFKLFNQLNDIMV